MNCPCSTNYSATRDSTPEYTCFVDSHSSNRLNSIELLKKKKKRKIEVIPHSEHEMCIFPIYRSPAVDLQKWSSHTVWPWHKWVRCRCWDFDRKWTTTNRPINHLKSMNQSVMWVKRVHLMIHTQWVEVDGQFTDCIIRDQIPIGRIIAERQIDDVIEHSFIASFPCRGWILTQYCAELVVGVIIVDLLIIVSGRCLFCGRRWFEFCLFGVYMLQKFGHIAGHELFIWRQPHQRGPFSNQFFNYDAD